MLPRAFDPPLLCMLDPGRDQNGHALANQPVSIVRLVTRFDNQVFIAASAEEPPVSPLLQLTREISEGCTSEY